MKKFTFSFIVVTCIALQLNGQSAAWSWATKGVARSSFNFVSAQSIALDTSNGSVAICGYFNDSLQFGSRILKAPPTYTNGYLTRYLSNKALSWSILIGSRSYLFCNKVAPGNSGSYYVFGSCFDTVKIGSLKSGATMGGSDFFIAKVNSAGSPAWIKTGGGANDDGILDMKSDKLFNPIALVTYNGSITIGSSTFTNNINFNRNAVLVKYRTNGTVFWANNIILPTAVGNLYDSRIAIDGSNNIYLFGRYTDAIQFGSTTLTTTPGNTSGYLVKFNSSGIVQWAVNTGSMGIGEIWSLDADNGGNVYASGTFRSTIQFGAISLTSLPGEYDAFVAKFNNLGIAQWAKRISSPTAQDIATGISVNKATGDVYATGTIGNVTGFGAITLTDVKGGFENGFVAKYNSAGMEQWAKLIDGTNSTVSYGIVVDPTRNAVYNAGYYNADAFFDAIRLNGGGTNNTSPYVSKLIETLGPRPALAPEFVNVKAQVNRLSIFPNPANESFSIQLPLSNLKNNQVQIVITNAEGKMILTKVKSTANNFLYDNFQIDNKLSPGTYFIRVIADGRQFTQKLIIE